MTIALNRSVSSSIAEEVRATDDVQAFFDAEYYRTRYADIFSNPQIDPLRHYCSVGWKQGRDPTNWFSTKRYLDSHPEVLAAGVNPFGPLLY